MQKWLEYYLLTATERGVINATFDEASQYKTASYNTGGVNVDYSGRINKSATKNTEIFQVQVFE